MDPSKLENEPKRTGWQNREMVMAAVEDLEDLIGLEDFRADVIKLLNKLVDCVRLDEQTKKERE
jgi:hypothetical protein